MVASVLLLWLAVSCPPQRAQAQAQDSAQELSNVPGTIDVVEGTPVTLSEARRVLLKPSLGPDGVSEIVIRVETTIANSSGRPIKELCLSLCFGSNKTEFTAEYRIGAAEVRRYSHVSMHVRGGTVPDGREWALTVRVRGAQFED